MVSIFLLAIISFGAVSAASDTTADDSAVGVTDDVEITADSDDIAISDDANDDSKLGASAEDDELSAGSVAPTYTINITPNVMDGSNYVAQYGQVITVSGEIQNATGNVSIRFGYSGNYHDYNVALVDGKFLKEITDYDRVRNNYQIQVKWAGDDYYKSISWSKNIHVQMNEVTANGAFYGLTPYMDVNLFNATGNVTFTLNGRNYTGKLENGKLIQEFTNYTIGKNTVDMYYHGDDRFNPIEKSFTFTVDANVETPTIYNYQQAIIKAYFGAATGKVNISLGNESYDLDIVGGVATCEFKNYTIGDNVLEISYSGDETFNPFKTTKTFEVLAKEDAKIISSVYKTATQNFIFITIPHANGTINVTVNGNKQEKELVNETVKWDIDPTDDINELIVSYEGNVRLNPSTSSFYVNLTDYIVNNKTFYNYFNQNDGGNLYDFIEDGVTLDFQGNVIINTDSANEMNIVINKPINIISSTKDAYIDLNCTAGSLLGEHPGSSFVVNRGGSGSNISGIYLHNTELWISNTTNVVFDNISVVVEDQRVGSGVGATSVRDNSSYVTLKNSYFYTRNNGGSTTFTFSWATHCTFDNNTVKAEGNVGNLLYLNVYNIKNLPEPTKTSWGDVLPNYPLNNYNTFSNNELFGKEGSAISVGIMVEGTYNIIANNTLHKCSISTSFGGTGAANNTYYGNILEQGSSFTGQSYSIIFNNTVPGSITTGTGSLAYNNTAGTTMTVTAGATAYENTVGTTMTVAAGSVAYNNTANGLTVSGANAIAHNNAVTGAVTVSGAGAEVYDNQLNGTIKVTGAGAKFHDNEAEGSLTVSGKNTEISDNQINADISVASTNVTLFENNISGTVDFTSAASECQAVNNTINSDNEYAVDLSSSKNNLLKGNLISGASLKGAEAIKNTDETNIIEGNYPLSVNLTVSVEDMLANQETTVVNIYINENATKTVRVIVNGETYYVKHDNGHGSVTLNRADFVEGAYSVVALYDGDDVYGPDQVLDSFVVFYHTAMLNIDVSEANAGEDIVVTVTMTCLDCAQTLTPLNDIELTIDNDTYSVPFESMSNVANFTIPAVGEGKHTIVAKYPGEKGIYECENITAFTLYKLDPVVDIAVDDLKLDEDANVTVTVMNATGTVNIIVDGVEHPVDLDNNGVATYTMKEVKAGVHSIVANYLGDAKNNAASASSTKELKVLATMFTNILVDGDLNIKAILIDSEGNAVANATIGYNIGSYINFTETDSNGVFTIKGIENSNVDIAYAGDDNLFPTSTVVALGNIAPSKVATVLTADNVTFTAGDSAVFKVVLKDAGGNSISHENITVVLNNKEYTLTTDANGTASMQISIANAGTYTAAVSFLGNTYNDASFTTATVTVKATPAPPSKKVTKITAKNKTFKAKIKTKKYTITLKSGSAAVKKVKVTLKIKGKTYKATTNNKGKATFKITKLTKKGKYSAVIKFAGDSTFNSANKKVKITIKK